MTDPRRALSAAATTRGRVWLAVMLAWVLAAGAAAAGPTPDPLADPLGSDQWVYIARRYFADATWAFDHRVKVLAPSAASNPATVPVQIRAPALGRARRIRVIADMDRQTRVLDFIPVRARPALAFSMRVDQATPVRAAVQTDDGRWHIGGKRIDAGGGGCSVPASAPAAFSPANSAQPITARLWHVGRGLQRLKLSIAHVMDGGRFAGGSRNFIDDITVRDVPGRLLARIQPGPQVAASPIFVLMLKHTGDVIVVAHATDGRHWLRRVAAPDRS